MIHRRRGRWRLARFCRGDDQKSRGCRKSPPRNQAARGRSLRGRAGGVRQSFSVRTPNTRNNHPTETADRSHQSTHTAPVTAQAHSTDCRTERKYEPVSPRGESHTDCPKYAASKTAVPPRTNSALDPSPHLHCAVASGRAYRAVAPPETPAYGACGHAL